MKASGIKIKSYTFEAVVEPDQLLDGRKAYNASIPALRGCSTWGYSIEEALKNLEKAARLLVDLMIERGEPIPDAKIKAKAQITINFPSE